MKKRKRTPAGIGFLRQKEEKVMIIKRLRNEFQLSEANSFKLVHELEVHQIELEMQNEELKLAKAQVEVASQKYQELYDFAPSGYFTLSREGKILELNVSGSKMLGLNHPDSSNSAFDLFVSRDTKPIFKVFLRKIFKSNAMETCEVTLAGKDNLPIYVYLTGHITQNGEHCVVNAVDISERRQTEEALRESEKRNHSLILQTAMDGYYMIDMQGFLREVNLTYCQMSGYSMPELLGMNLSELEVSETVDETAAHMKKVVMMGEDRFETRHRRKDGSTFDVEINARYQPIKGGRFFVFLHDITERKKAEEVLIESEQRYRSLFEESKDAIFLVDLTSGRYMDCNRLAESLTGFTRDEILQMKSGTFLSPHRKEELVFNMEVIMSGKVLRRETEITNRNGDLIPVEFSASKVTINKKQYILSLLHDISERKAAEEALRQSEESVRVKLQSILSPEGSISNLELNDIIDAPSIQKLMDNFYELTQIPTAIIDTRGKVLVGVGWQEICTKFHRVHPESCSNCIESDINLTQGISDDEFRLYKCKNNMWDIATPIIIGGEIKGNLFMGQFFFENEPIEYKLFSEQADHYGFNSPEYLGALAKVPRLSRQKLDHAKAFFLNLSRSISQLSYSNIKLARAIAQQKQVECALRENEEILKKAEEIAHLGSWSLDLTTNRLTWSDEMYRIFDVQQKEFPATYEGFLDSVHPDDRDAVNFAYTNSILEGKNSYEVEHRIFCKHSGALRHVLEKCEHIRDDSGKIIRSMGMTHDITERKQSAEAMMENEHLLTDSQAVAHIGSYKTDLIARTWKGTFETDKILGIDETYPHTLEGLADLIHPDSRNEIFGYHMHDEVKKNWFDHEFKIIRFNDGKERWVHGLGELEFDHQRKPIRIIGTLRDVTKRKMVEEALRHLNEELEDRVKQRTAELLNVTDEVEERERNRFSRELHDGLGPLLSAVKLYFQWLSETEDVEKIRIITEKGNNYIEKAIQTTREVALGLNSVILNNLGYADTLLNFIQSINDTKKLTINFTYNSNDRFNNLLETSLYRITTELINNTLKYAKATYVNISFNYHKAKNSIAFSYIDNGIGFDLDNTTTMNKGLGLMNIQQRIKIIGGMFKIETGSGKGMKVFIELPVNEISMKYA